MPPPAPAFQYNPSQVRLLVSRSLMDLIILEGINQGNTPRVTKAPRGGPEGWP